MEIYQKGIKQYFQIQVIDKQGNVISGIPIEDITIQIYREIDDKYFNVDTHSFVVSGGIAEIGLVEFGTRGIYRFQFDQSLDEDTNGVYTLIYTVKSPFYSQSCESVTFVDMKLADIKGEGWDDAYYKPTLMGLANKYIPSTFNPSSHSLQAIYESVQSSLQEGVNISAF